MLLATCNALKLKFKIFDFERYFLFKTVKNFYLLKFKKQFKKETVQNFIFCKKKFIKVLDILYTRGGFLYIENLNESFELHNKLTKPFFSLIFFLFLVEILNITGKMLKMKIFLICYENL